jgi:hypothetical protein
MTPHEQADAIKLLRKWYGAWETGTLIDELPGLVDATGAFLRNESPVSPILRNTFPAFVENLYKEVAACELCPLPSGHPGPHSGSTT